MYLVCSTTCYSVCLKIYWFSSSMMCWHVRFLHRHPATAKWYDRRDSVFVEFCVADSKDLKINFDKKKFVFRYVSLALSLENEIVLYHIVLLYIYCIETHHWSSTGPRSPCPYCELSLTLQQYSNMILLWPNVPLN